jgi:hypothetical protein
MKHQRFLGVVTLINIILVLVAAAQMRAIPVSTVAPVLRGRGLEIVDDKGRVRASISILPADPKYRMPDGTVGYPETVLLRLITPEGRPNVKIGTSTRGSGALFAGEDDPTYVQILSEGSATSMKFSEKENRERVIEP